MRLEFLPFQVISDKTWLQFTCCNETLFLRRGRSLKRHIKDQGTSRHYLKRSQLWGTNNDSWESWLSAPKHGEDMDFREPKGWSPGSKETPCVNTQRGNQSLPRAPEGLIRYISVCFHILLGEEQRFVKIKPAASFPASSFSNSSHWCYLKQKDRAKDSTSDKRLWSELN